MSIKYIILREIEKYIKILFLVSIEQIDIAFLFLNIIYMIIFDIKNKKCLIIKL